MTHTGRLLPALALLGGFLAVSAGDAQALPRYSALYRQNCNLCHVNPTGGGMRTLYASQFIVPSELAIRRLDVEELEPLGPQISRNITIGADLRTTYIYSDLDIANTNFFQMQGDIYLEFALDARTSLYFDRGSSSTLELFGLAYLLPWNGYLKIGRFTPAYGWKYDDHTSFVRDYLGYFPPDHTDVGIEAGLYPGRGSLIASLTNGNLGARAIQDDNRDLAVTFRGAYSFRLGPVALLLGASGRHNPLTGGVEDVGGAYAYLQWKGLTWVGELDGIRWDPSGSDAVHSLVSTQELTYLIRRGVTLKATYDVYDPRYYQETGALQRFGGGVFVFPNQYFALEGLLRGYDFKNGRDLEGDDYVELALQFHFLY